MAIPVHPSAEILTMIEGQAWEDFKEAIRTTGGNREPVVVYKGQLLDGRHRVRAVQELRKEGHEVELRQMDWGDTNSETVTEFILRTNLHRRHLTDDQRAAITLKLQPQIETERTERQRATLIQPGERRNPHGRRGKPELAEAKASSPSPEERREQNRRKDARSTAGQVAIRAGVTTHKAKQVLKAVKDAGPQAIELLATGKATAKQLLKKPSKPKQAPDPHLQMEFRKFVTEGYRRLLAKHPVADQKAVRAFLIKLIRGEQKKHGEIKVRKNTAGAVGVIS